jgi:hypothetical protein
MSSLRETLTALLADLTHAQHQANRLSHKLSKQYADDAYLRAFPVPNAAFDEVTVDLHFAVRDAAGHDAAGHDAAEASRAEASTDEASASGGAADGAADGAEGVVRALPMAACIRLGRQVARLVLRHACRTLDEHLEAGRGDEQCRAVRAGLDTARVADDLGDRLGLAVQQWWQTRLMATAPAAPRPFAADTEHDGAAQRLRNGLHAATLHALRASLLADADVCAALDPPERAADASERAADASRRPPEEQLATWMRDRKVQEVLRAFAERMTPLLPAVDDARINHIVLNADALKTYPVRALQSLVLRVKMRDYRWVVQEDGYSEELLPDD